MKDQNHGAQAQRQEKTLEQPEKNSVSHQRNEDRKGGQQPPQKPWTMTQQQPLQTRKSATPTKIPPRRRQNKDIPRPTQGRELAVGTDLSCGTAMTAWSGLQPNRGGAVPG